MSTSDMPVLLDLVIAIATADSNQFTRAAAVCSMRAEGSDVALPAEVSTHTTVNSFALQSTLTYLKMVAAGLPSDVNLAGTTVIINNEFVVDGFSKWLRNWKANGWRTKTGTSVKMRELWEELDEVAQSIGATFVYESPAAIVDTYDLAFAAIPDAKLRGKTGSFAVGGEVEMIYLRTGAKKSAPPIPEPPLPMLSGQGMW